MEVRHWCGTTPPAQLPARSQCPINVRTNLAKSFVAVISGNAIYFILLMPLLPPVARHKPYQLDLGLIVDFWVCLACYGIVELISRRTRAGRKS